MPTPAANPIHLATVGMGIASVLSHRVSLVTVRRHLQVKARRC